MKKLENKTAVITGGAGSIGKATAALFLEEGAKVLLIDLDEEALKQTAAELGNENISWCAADVSNTDDVKRYANEAKKTFGSVDIFFNNAGIEGVVKPVTDYPEDEFDKVMAVNVKGVWSGMSRLWPMVEASF
jgi:NAD(P)-dependent dehydrogenase (short-subunit alcohol dehydrogenase family)